jgi:acyl carrier protein phosphodiesterase
LNFLAHLHLADPDPGLMLGGIVADFARNPEVATLPRDVRAGVKLHRLIDGFTDSHPVVQRSIARISPRMGWFSGIVIDIYYDHVLARNWADYSTEPLRQFADRAYRLLDGLFPFATPDGQWFIRRLIDRDYLVGYSTVEGITRALDRVSQRIAERIPKKAVALTDAIPDLTAADADLATDFHTFYPELLAFAAEQRRTLAD